MPVKLSDLFLQPTHTIAEAAACIDRTEQKIALVVGADQRLVGTVVDGDIRRAILADVSMDAPVTALLDRKPEPYRKPLTAHVDTSKAVMSQIMREHQVQHMPLLDDDGRVVGLFQSSNAVHPEKLQLQAVVMAGGKGMRLRPLTENMPKPMLPLNGRPLLERIVTQLRDAGIRDINLTTNYLAEVIEEHFKDGSDFGVRVNYIAEQHPMGTGGGLSLLETPEHPLLVMNGDLVTDVNFAAMLAYHQEKAAKLTVAVRRFEFTVPYGVVESDDGYVTRLAEKPSLGFFVNAGIYIVEPEVQATIPTDQRTDMTDIIQQLLDTGQKVAEFPIHEYWLDIGQHHDYERAQRELFEKENAS